VFTASPEGEHLTAGCFPPATGVLQVTGRIDRDVLPLQLHPNISVIVRVEDSPHGGHSSEMEITVIIGDINDNPPECNPSTFRY